MSKVSQAVSVLLHAKDSHSVVDKFANEQFVEVIAKEKRPPWEGVSYIGFEILDLDTIRVKYTRSTDRISNEEYFDVEL